MAKDNTLIYHAQTGDEEAFADLMREHYAFVYGIVIRIVKNSHDAEEVVQDAFLNAYRGLAQLEDATKFKSWLGEIAQNCARNWLRKQRNDTVSIDEVSENLLQTQDLPDERLTQLEQRELIRRIIETLPQKDREIAHAYYLEGASYDELTSTHGLSYNAIAFRLSRAKQQLTKRLQYLLTGIFVSPAMTLKKIYSGGLTVMKVGTVPKITVGIAALVALIFIGFVGVRQMNAPTVEERVYLTPWEDGTPRPQNNAEDLAAQTDSAQDAANRDNQSQISTEGLELDDFSGQSEDTDPEQFATEGEFESEMDQSFFADISVLLDDEGRSAEEVMAAYVEAHKNADFEVLLPLVTEAARERVDRILPVFSGELSEELVNKVVGNMADIADNMPEGMSEDMVDRGIQMMLETMQDPEIIARAREMFSQMYGQVEVVSGEYVGDEFHFQTRIPMPELPEMPQVPGLELPEIPELPESMDSLVKMRKVNGVWQIYHDRPE